MATLPSASTTIDDEAGALAGGTGYAIVMGCVAENDDITPRVYTSTKGILDQHGYSPAVDYAALHFEATRQPVIFIGLPKTTAGAAARQNVAGVLGTSVITITAGANGIVEETDCILEVAAAGTVGTAGIAFDFSADGGRTTKRIRLGTATSYTVPYLGIVINFAAGTLLVGDTATFTTTAPMWSGADLATAKDALAAQLKLARSFVIVGDITNSTFAGYVTTEANGYETENQRFVVARAQVRDRIPRVSISGVSMTYAEVGATADTITRASGSFLTDGIRVGDLISSTSALNTFTDATVAAVTALVITLDTQDLVAEVTSAGTITKGETVAAYVAAMDTAFSTVDSQKRIDLGLGRARKLSPITAWSFRRPVSWAASIREYQHDVQIPTWRKADGPLDGWDLTDGNGNVVEYDERIDGGALAARFTCFRTWSNGPSGAFIALSLTRAVEGSNLSRTHNMHVVDVACSVVQTETENAIGEVLQLKSDGTGTDASLGKLEGRVNSALQTALLQSRSEGPRASSAVWVASRSAVLNVPEAALTGVLTIMLNGTLERIDTTVRVQTNG